MNEFSIKNVELPTRNYEKIKFNIKKLKNIDKIYKNYNIQVGETIIAYIKSSVIIFPLSADGNIITDKALYHHPAHEDWSSNNRVPFSDLCKYVVLMHDEKSELTLINSEEEHTIVGNTLFRKNRGGMELLLFLSDIQKYLISNFDWALNQKDTEIKRIILKSNQWMREGRLSENILGALQLIKLDDKYCLDAIIIESEYLYRQCDMDQFVSFMNSIDNVSIKSQISNKICEFKTNFINDIENYRFVINEEFLNIARKNILKMENISDEYCNILLYICIRLRDNTMYSDFLKKTQKANDRYFVRRLDFFKNSYYNIQMKSIYEKIKEGIFIDDKQMEWTDSLGLNSLHYAIILKKEAVIQNILRRNKIVHNNPLKESDTAACFYDYNVLAAYFDIQCKNDICFYTTPEVVSKYYEYINLRQNHEKTKKEFDSLRKRKAILYREYSMAMNNNDNDRKRIINDEIKMVETTLSNMMQLLDNMNQEEDMLQDEIDYLIENILNDSYNVSLRLKDIANPFSIFLLSLYNNNDLLYHILSDTSDEKYMYIYNEILFVTPKDVYIELYYYDDLYGEKKQHPSHNRNNLGSSYFAQSKKPYGNSWFSPEAHHNIKILKKEYILLAKKYHPDKTQLQETSIVFNEITLERNMIKEKLE